MRAVLFDFDGVLVDSEPLHYRAMRDALVAEGLTIGEEEYWRHLLAHDDRTAIRIALERHGVAFDAARVETVTRGCLDGEVVDSIAPVAPHDGAAPRPVPVGSGAWQQMSVPAGVYLRAISMATPQVGYAAGELGKIYTGA